jgi:sec-independent protein translocase protein TatB
MFDIGFTELLVIGVVALIVIGPERLPGVARTLGHLFGRMQRYVNEVKADIQREVELDELKKLRESVEQSAREIEQSVNRELDTAGREMQELQSLVDSATHRVADRPRVEGAADASAAGAAPGATPAAADQHPHEDAALDSAALPEAKPAAADAPAHAAEGRAGEPVAPAPKGA